MKQLDKILLIEDDDTVNFYNEFILKELGATKEVVITTNGKEGIDYLLSCKDTDTALPQLIFLDINMPVMNGFEFLEALESNGLTGSTIIVMLTTSLHPADLDRASKHPSISDYVYKPLMRERLSQILDGHFVSN